MAEVGGDSRGMPSLDRGRIFDVQHISTRWIVAEGATQLPAQQCAAGGVVVFADRIRLSRCASYRLCWGSTLVHHP